MLSCRVSADSGMGETCINTTEAQDLAHVVSLIPELSYSTRKGQMGRIAILGGQYSLFMGLRLRR
jgi:NAD(P)H-hydrate repair Nnr-like enzyme with NAD(P)H-hydrate dehydratase domain